MNWTLWRVKELGSSMKEKKAVDILGIRKIADTHSQIDLVIICNCNL